MTVVWSAARSSVGAIAFDAAAILVASPARTDEPRPDLGECRLESPGTGRRRTTTRSSEGWMMKFSNRRVDDPGDAARRGASPGGGETHLAERGGDAERRRGFQRALNHEHRVCASRATRSVSAADNRIEESRRFGEHGKMNDFLYSFSSLPLSQNTGRNAENTRLFNRTWEEGPGNGNIHAGS